MSDAREWERRRRAERARRARPPEQIEREVSQLLSWLSPGEGSRLGILSACSCHPRALASRGLDVRPLDPEDWIGVLPSRGEASPPPEPWSALVFLETTLLPFWEVEEIHRLRLRRAYERIASGGRLVFGEPETFGRFVLEHDRLTGRAADPAAEGVAIAEAGRLSARSRFTHYSPAQAHALLAQCGFCLERISNGFEERPLYEHDRPGMIFVCRRV